MALFEIVKTDMCARIARITTNHGTVDTPAYVPVIHPVKQSIPAETIRRMGFDVIITNAYIMRKNHMQEARERGVHDTMGYDGAIMTDSGGYQVLEYGDLDVTPEQMQEFETSIMTDFAVPLDKPTGFGLPHRKAASYVRHTLDVCGQTLESSADNGQIWMGPIQGGEHEDLVRRSARGLVKMGFEMLALGSPVEFMESYRYGLLARMITVAKRNIPHNVPLHLFGAGHPLTIPLAVSLGCDTFDSASYMLYARQGRYMTEDGTRHISEMSYFACTCPTCTSYTPPELAAEAPARRINAVALHNLYAIKREVDSVREAIFEGRLWEYVMKKCRAHPMLYNAVDEIIDSSEAMQATTPRFKERALFLYGPEDQFRPEIVRYNGYVRRFRTGKKRLIIMPETALKPAYLSPEYRALRRITGVDGCQVCQYNPVVGIIPVEISDIYPASHYVASRMHQGPGEFAAFAETWRIFFENNSFEEITYDKNDRFIEYFVRRIPYRISRRSYNTIMTQAGTRGGRADDIVLKKDKKKRVC